MIMVLRYVDELHARCDPADLALHDAAVLRVEGAERLVHQQHVGLDGEGARDRPARAHAAAHAAGVVVLEAGEPDELEIAVGARRALGRRHAERTEHQRDVVAQ